VPLATLVLPCFPYYCFMQRPVVCPSTVLPFPSRIPPRVASTGRECRRWHVLRCIAQRTSKSKRVSIVKMCVWSLIHSVSCDFRLLDRVRAAYELQSIGVPALFAFSQNHASQVTIFTLSRRNSVFKYIQFVYFDMLQELEAKLLGCTHSVKIAPTKGSRNSSYV